jgi:aspartate/methionine/tyrosine aminotransferase
MTSTPSIFPAVGFPAESRHAIRKLQASLIREVADRALGHEDVLPFWFGESDQPTPAFIREAAVASLASGETQYSQNLGRPYLREAIADYLGRLHGSDIPVDRVAVVGSGVSGLMLSMQAILAPGDRVVAVTPLWPNIVEIPRILGAVVQRVPLVVGGGRWGLDVDRLLHALTPQTRMLILNSPNNPTGWTIDAESLDAILSRCRRLGIWILADDVYERLVHDPAVGSAPSVLTRYAKGDRLISVNSFSKAWTMTGWRVGWLVAPEAIVRDLAKIIEYNTSCVFEPAQRAALVALKDGEGEIARLRGHLRTTRATLVDALAAMPGFTVPDAGGAMYVFFRIDGHSDSMSLAKRLVDEAGLGLAPGAAFGPEGQGWLRWCHAVTDQRLLEGIERLGKFMAAAR